MPTSGSAHQTKPESSRWAQHTNRTKDEQIMGFLEDQIAAAKAKEKEAKAKVAAKRRADIAKARQLAKKMESNIAVRVAAKLH